MYYKKDNLKQAFHTFDPEFHFIFQYKVLEDIILIDLIKKRYYRNYSQNYSSIELFIKERIRVNGILPQKKHQLKQNDFVQYLHKKSDENSLSNLKIIYENEYLIVIDKMPYQPHSPMIPTYFNSIIMQLKRIYPNQSFYTIHRLDTDTTGVLMLAKTKEAASKFSQLFLRNKVQKLYHTIVYGKFNDRINEVYGRIEKDKSCFTFSKWKLTASEDKESLSYFAILNSNDKFSELEVKPVTGKTNQIRIHLSSVGFPIIGDMKYYNDLSVYKNWFEKGITDSRMLLDTYILNCKTLTLKDPISEQELLLKSDQLDYTERKNKIINHYSPKILKELT